jgi:hypothetical protein
VPFGIAPRHGERGPRDVGAEAGRRRPPGEAGDEDRAAAGAEVDHPGEGRRERQCHQRLGLGPRVEHRRRDLEVAAPEGAAPEDLRHRLPRGPGREHRLETGFGGGIERRVEMQDQPPAFDAERAGQQRLRVARRIGHPGRRQPRPRRGERLLPRHASSSASWLA